VATSTATEPAPGSTGPVAHHFNNMGQQLATVRFGMWLFLVTEVLFFGGAFCAYTVYRVWFPKDFEAGSAALNVGIASVNTFLLLTSSLTITLAIRSAWLGSKKALFNYLLLTTVLGTAFLGLKAREYYLDYEEGLIPGNSRLTSDAKREVDKERAKLYTEAEAIKAALVLNRAAANDATKTDAERTFAAIAVADKERQLLHTLAIAGEAPNAFNENLKVALHHADFKGVAGKDYDPSRVQLFFMFYYSMTGLHVLHMIVGLGLLVWQLALVKMGFFDYTARYVYIETMSLYWHFVDMVWMFLLPLLYLCGPHTASQAVSQFKEAIGLATGSGTH